MTKEAFSAGARYERAALRNMLRRRMRRVATLYQPAYAEIIDWVLARQKRYDKRKGGL